MQASDQLRSEYWVLDFDRTLFSIEKNIEQFCRIGESLGLLSKKSIVQEQQHAESQGASFDVYEFIVQTYGLDVWDQLSTAYVKSVDATCLLLPGATELLDYLAVRSIQHGIVTFGSKHWQQLKLDAAGFENIPSIIVDTPDKASIVKTWLDENGTYTIPDELVDDPKIGTLAVRSVVIVDDKSRAFSSLPPRTKGYWVQTGHDTGDKTLPFTTTVQDLYQLIRSLVEQG